MIGTLIDGYDTLSDVLFLIAAIVFVLAAIARAFNPPSAPGWLLEAGLALVAVAWLVL